MQLLNGQANKFLVCVLGAVATSLSTYYGTQKWEAIVFTALTAVIAYLVPNSPKP
jgi:uncharacterized membrane protein (DUF4010 family)